MFMCWFILDLGNISLLQSMDTASNSSSTIWIISGSLAVHPDHSSHHEVYIHPTNQLPCLLGCLLLADQDRSQLQRNTIFLIPFTFGCLRQVRSNQSRTLFISAQGSCLLREASILRNTVTSRRFVWSIRLYPPSFRWWLSLMGNLTSLQDVFDWNIATGYDIWVMEGGRVKWKFHW